MFLVLHLFQGPVNILVVHMYYVQPDMFSYCVKLVIGIATVAAEVPAAMVILGLMVKRG